MGRTLSLLYEYVQDLKHLIKKAEELAQKSVLKEVLSNFHEIKDFNELNIRETEYLISLSRILADYGFSQTYESFENACSLLLTDCDHTKEAVDMAIEKLKKSASSLYANKAEADFLWGARKVNDPWALLMKMLTKSDDEAAARRSFYSTRIAELAIPNSLANATPDEREEIISSLSPLQLEMDFTVEDGILKEILSLHANETGLG